MQSFTFAIKIKCPKEFTRAKVRKLLKAVLDVGIADATETTYKAERGVVDNTNIDDADAVMKCKFNSPQFLL